ncbi:Chromodomain Y-like protein 2 [Nymphon striatum]|nr:Chromodomain Y-like protein 2 [Nymphon striatum]
MFVCQHIFFIINIYRTYQLLEEHVLPLFGGCPKVKCLGKTVVIHVVQIWCVNCHCHQSIHSVRSKSISGFGFDEVVSTETSFTISSGEWQSDGNLHNLAEVGTYQTCLIAMDQPLCTSDVMAGNSKQGVETIVSVENLSLEKHQTLSKSSSIPTGVIDLQQDENSVVECQFPTLSHCNGIINNFESYSTDEELEAIENQSKLRLSENNNTITESENHKIISHDNGLTPPLLTPVETVEDPSNPEDSSEDSSDRPPSPLFYYPSQSLENCSFEANSDTDRSFVSSDLQETPSLSVKNQAEHMLTAVREINTPWAKELELRLAQEIKLDGQNKRDLNLDMNGQDYKPNGKRGKRKYRNSELNDRNVANLEMNGPNSKKGSREHGNLMKAMVEIGAPWASEIQQENYLPQRTREKVNYKVTGRQKKDEPTQTKDETPQKKATVSNLLSAKHLEKLDKKLLNSVILNTKSSKCAPKQTKAVDIKISDIKNKKAAQKLLKRAVGVSQKRKLCDKNVKIKFKKSTANSKAKAKTNLKVKKTIAKAKISAAVRKKIRIAVKSVKNDQKKSQTKEKSKNGKLPQPTTNKVPSNENSKNVGSVQLMKHFLTNNVKITKLVKNNIIESNLKNVEKVTACISSSDDLPTSKQRQSMRQQIHSAVFKEIGVRKHSHFLQITFLNRHNASYLGIQALKELKNAFVAAKQDPTCRLVLLNGSGRVFCSGLDLGSICTRDNQKVIAELTHALRDVLKYMVTFPKPIVAGVNGSAVGLGATILPICDLIYASDKATFSTPYVKLSQVPEGGATFSFPRILGSAIASDMLLNGRILTAQEACQHGLVSQVMWPSQFMETLFPKVLNLANESSQEALRPVAGVNLTELLSSLSELKPWWTNSISHTIVKNLHVARKGMEATKQLIKASCKLQLDTHIEKECTLLNTQWNSQACQKAIMTAFQNRYHLST